MKLTDVLALLGGLALFLHGMQMMSSGLEAAAGNKMKEILERLTSNRFLGVLIGALITAAIQSSSATTVMVVGFVNAGMMTLNQAVWIIMGANIGSTVTSMLIALDVGDLAPIVAFIGVVIMVFIKKPRVQHIGQILAGLGVLFIGMDMMSASMLPLRDSPWFISAVSTFSNPLVGITTGLVFTAIIQSSAASVGIMQALAGNGVVTLSSAVFVLFGQNIGTCVTALLASFGTNRNAKRATLIHFMFNVIGAFIFTILCISFPVTDWIEQLLPNQPQGQIATMHIIFNLTTTALLLPLGNQLAQLSRILLPERASAQKGKDEMTLAYLTPVQTGGKDGGLGVSAIVIDQLGNELHRMLAMARENVDDCFQAVLTRESARLEQVQKREQYIDFLNKEISHYVSQLISLETNEHGSAVVSAFFTISGNIERIGDHADNLAGYTNFLVKENITFSPAAQQEIRSMQEKALQAIDALFAPDAGSEAWLKAVLQREDEIDDMTESFRHGQLSRMRSGECNEEACILFSEMLTDFERIGDHVLNIAQSLTKVHSKM